MQFINKTARKEERKRGGSRLGETDPCLYFLSSYYSFPHVSGGGSICNHRRHGWMWEKCPSHSNMYNVLPNVTWDTLFHFCLSRPGGNTKKTSEWRNLHLQRHFALDKVMQTITLLCLHRGSMAGWPSERARVSGAVDPVFLFSMRREHGAAVFTKLH